MSVSNWNGSNTCAPAAVATPRDLDELVAIVRDPRFPSPVRALGELHSLNESIETAGTAVFMTHFSRIDEPDPVKRRVTVGAGVRMIDLKNALKRHGLQLPVVPEIGNATAGSVACCGTKDSSLGPTGRGQISSTVVSLRLVRPDGRTEHVTDSEALRLVRGSYGLLGIVYEVTFEVEARRRVWYSYERIRLDRWLESGRPLPAPDGDEILGGADGFLGFLLPYRRQLIVERRRLARRHRPVMILDAVRLWLRTFAWMSGARPFNAPLALLPPWAVARQQAARRGLGLVLVLAGLTMVAVYGLAPIHFASAAAKWIKVLLFLALISAVAWMNLGPVPSREEVTR